MTDKIKNGVAPAVGECVRELRAEAPKATTYQMVEVLTPDGRKVWQLNLTTPNENLIDGVMQRLYDFFNE